ncbi:LOW QUALITY PROTEIN: hypothetical protein ACHAXM_009632 [Skeletonema potamos]
MSRQLATSTSTVTVIIVAAIFCWVLHTFYLIATVTVLPPDVLADIPSKKEIGSTSTIIKTETEPTKQNLANVPKNKKHIKHTSIINNTESLYIITTNGEENPSKSKKNCICDFISTDCLASIHCMPNHQASLKQIVKGILFRKLVKETVKYKVEVSFNNLRPIGKLLQYKAQETWSSWVQHNIIPEQHAPINYMFVNSSRLPGEEFACSSLLLYSNYEDEEYGDIEVEAEPYVKEMLSSSETRHELMSRLKTIQQAQLQNVVIVGADKSRSVELLDYLTSMAHLLRIQFNRRQPLIEITNRAVVFNAKKEENNAQKEGLIPPLRVSLHLRRADSCNHGLKESKKEASSLFKSPQPTPLRVCYETSVYMNALRRVQIMVQEKEPNRHIEVFVSSDHAGALIEEIQSQFSGLYNSMTWHFHSTGRETFKYTGMIESNDHSVHDMLGETAAADIWLLSRGEVFIGHLGSRFGKVAYLLATARHNRFIPFFSVDGHSYCCEVDEPCGEMKPYIIDMTDCLVFAHERKLPNSELNKDYWEVGSLARKIIAERNQNALQQTKAAVVS